MIAGAENLDAVVAFDPPVHRLLRQRGRIVGVQVHGGTIRSEHVILAAGLDSSRLAAQTGLELPLRAGRGYGVDLEPRGATPRMPIRFKDRRIVVTPLPDRLCVCGSMEFGVEGKPVDRRHAHRLVEVAARGIPSLRDHRIIDVWAGDRPCASNGIPVVGLSTRVPGLGIAAGHGMWGLILAPASAQVIADGVHKQLDEASGGAFSPDRLRMRQQ